MVITQRHEVIIRFLLVTAWILFRSATISTKPSLPYKPDLSVRTTWASIVVPTNARTSKNAVLSHLQQTCVRFGGLRGYRITPVQLRSVSITHVKPNSLMDGISHPLWERWTSGNCARVGRGQSRIAGIDFYPTHNTTTKADMPSASTCSILSFQKGRALLQRRTCRKENRKDYGDIINECYTTSNSPCIPHDFLPCQAYLIFATVNLAKGGSDEMVYLVCQGQQEVVKENGGDRDSIILVVILHTESLNR